jgi:hypothetical protein
MPIATADLSGAMTTLINNTQEHTADIKGEWAKLAKTFFSEVIMPAFVDHGAGQAAFKSALSLTPPTFGTTLAAAFVAYAATAAAGAAGTVKMTPIKPPVGLTLAATSALVANGASTSTFASTLTTELKAWAISGTYTADNTIPAPVILPWT